MPSKRGKGAGTKNDKPKKRINSRTKGKVGELELVNFMKERGFDCRRGQQFAGGTDSPDVLTNCPALEGYHIEVKRKEAGNPYEWLRQAATDAGLFKVPVVAHRRNKERWIAIIDFRDFLALVANALTAGPKS